MTHSFTLGSARRTVQALALAGLTCLVAPTQSADLTLSFFYPGGQVILSGFPDGTGDTTPGDTTMVTLEQVQAFAKGGSARIQR